MNEECIFCKIIARKVPADIVHETETSLIFKDIKPSAPVHLLIVPKKHVISIAELEEADRGMVSDLIYTAKEEASRQGLAGYQLAFNVGRGGGQLVDHIHLHLKGGWQ